MTNRVCLVTCCVARRPGYFYWNVYLLIFLITFIALTVYSVAPEYPQSRLQITCSLSTASSSLGGSPRSRYTLAHVHHVPLVGLAPSSTCLLLDSTR